MIQKKIALACLVLMAHAGNAQKLANPNVVELKSPQAAQIEKIGLIANSLQTGQITPSIDIYEVKTAEMSIPISLNYSNTGLRIGETPTWVGHGWNLATRAGIITQTVKGLPDDGPAGLANAANSIDLLRYLNNQMPIMERLNYENAAAALEKDTERDIFSFNFLGQSGSFYFDANGIIKQFNRTDIKINYIPQSGFFSIVDERGFKYDFNNKEATSFSQDEVTSNTPIVVNGSTWYLTKITTPLNDAVTFEYTEAKNFNEISYPYSLNFGAKTSPPDQNGHTMCYNDNSLTDISIAQVFSTASEKLLKQITTRNIKVVFNTLPIREDLTYTGANPVKGRALEEILVTTTGGQLIKRTKFTYSHFPDFNYLPKNRLKLVKMANYGSSGNEAMEHSFSYYNETSAFPPLGLLSKDFDHWGYYNGAYNNMTVPAFNAGLVNGLSGQYNGADKNAKGIYSKYGMLQQINYPTGGSTRFEYEPNRIDLSGYTSLPLFINIPANSNTAAYEVGGNRIKKVTYYDYDNHEALQQNFEYDTVTQLKYEPNYLSNKERLKEDAPGTFLSCGTFWVVSDRPVNSMPGFAIEYSSVTEKNQTISDNGYTKTYYAKTDDYGGSIYPFPTIINTNWRSGLVSETNVYKRNAPNIYQLVKKNTAAFNNSLSNPMSLDGTNVKIVLHQVSGMNATTPTTGSRYTSAIYTYFTEDSKQTAGTENDYSGSTEVSKTTSFEYTNPLHCQITRQTTQNSAGETESIDFKYPADFASTPPYNEMLNKNMVATVVEQIQTNITKGKELTRDKTNFQWWQGNAFVLPVTVQKSVWGNALVTEATVNTYDRRGNMLEGTGKDGVITAYIWGYDSTYPVAKIINKPYADAIVQSGINMSIVNNPADDAAMRTELNKLRALPGTFVTTYTYNLLTGITSETDANNNTIHYEYDSFGRLKLIKDKDGNVVKQLDYAYKTSGN
jgi:YD repeat-containing protein